MMLFVTSSRFSHVSLGKILTTYLLHAPGKAFKWIGREDSGRLQIWKVGLVFGTR
jgi:hypothetical protein